jgi:rhamnogalacturonyl hydrolase YesR
MPIHAVTDLRFLIPMPNWTISTTALVFLVCGSARAASAPVAEVAPAVSANAPESPAELSRMMERILDFPYAEISERAKYEWKVGTFFTGVMAAYRTTKEPRFLAVARDWSEARRWKLHGTPLFADNLTLAQTYLDLYLEFHDPVMIAATRAGLENYFNRTSVKKPEFYSKWTEAERPFEGRYVWWWCDALYMAPPLFAQMYAATGERRYLDVMDRLYWDTIEYLYDHEDHLVFRDLGFLDNKSPGGKKIFWARGNGWVYAGLAQLLERLPKDAPRRADYLRLYQELTASILKYQGTDGLWRSSLNEPEWWPEAESSGTAFFCYGLLAGVNRGWLPEAGHLAPALKAWAGLKGCLDEHGWLVHAQGVGEKPGAVATGVVIDYAQGAFLLAASEMYVRAGQASAAK